MTQTVLWRIMSAVRRDLPSGTVTFLFTDIEGSTKLLHELGAEAYAEALVEHRRILREAFARHGGVEVDTQGDAFFVAFPTAPGADGNAKKNASPCVSTSTPPCAAQAWRTTRRCCASASA